MTLISTSPRILRASDGKFYRVIHNGLGNRGSYRRCAEDGTIHIPVRVSKKARIRARRAKEDWRAQNSNAFAVSDISLGKTAYPL